MKTAFIWPLIALLGLSAIAQSPSAKDSSTEKSSQKTAADFPDEPYLYEYVRGTMRYENDGTGTREVRARIRVQTAAGLKEAGQLVFDYNAANEHLDIRSVKVIKADGTIVKAGPDAVQDLSAPVAREAPLYTDARQKHVTVPGLAVGDTVEYEVVTNIQPLVAGQFWHNWNFISTKICLDEQVELNIPRSRAAKIKSPAELDPVVREEGDRKIYRWSTSNLQHPEVPDMFKNFKFDPKTLLEGRRHRPLRTLMVSTFQSWDEVGNWYAQLEKDRRVVTPEIRTRADAIVQGQTTDLARATALYDWVSRNIRYVSLSFGVGRYQPHAAAEVLENRYGDCKDKSTLLDAFLEAEKIHSQTVLVNTEEDVDSDLPTPSQFDHAINMVKIEGQERWLDSTLGVGPFGYLMPQLRGKQSLVVFTDAPPALQSSPSKLGVTTLYALEVKGEVTDKGKMDATISVDVRGEWEVLVRRGVLEMPPGQMESLLQMFSRQANQGAHEDFSLSDFKNSDPSDISKPFHMEVRVSGTLKDADLKDLKKDEDLGSSAQDLVRALTHKGPSGSDSLIALLPEHAIGLEGPKEYSLKLEFTLPLKAESKAKPMDVHITRDFADYQATTSWENHTMRASWRLMIRVPELPPAQAKEYASFRKEIVASLVNWGGKAKKSKNSKDSVVVDLTPSAKTSAEALPPATAALYTKAQSAMEAHNWGNAEQALESLVKEVPDFEYGWSNLGETRMALHKYAEAEAAYRKYLELAPNLSTPYLHLATALNAQEKYSESVELLEKDLARDPRDAPALRELGFVHLRLRQPELAVRDLEKASSISPDHAYGQFLLGSAYVDFDKHDKAAATFERAIGLDSSDTMLNRAAYRLAEGKTHLDKAESWSSRSISQVELELNQSTLATIQAKTATLASRTGSYWDTMGWIKFQKNDLAAAEKYISAAWELSDSTTIGAHLARIYEVQGNKDKAIETYAQTLATVSGTRTPTDDEKEARKRLAELLGNEALVEARINESKPRAKERRSVQIANSAHAEGIAQYLVIIGPSARVTDMQAAGPDSQLDGLLDAIRASSIPQSFPDDTIRKLPRTAVLACARSDQPCKFSLLSSAAAARTFPEEQPSQAGVP